MSAPKGLGRGPGANYCALVGILIFYCLAILNYQGTDVRTERFRSKPISVLKGLGRGPNATYCAVFGNLIFYFPAFLNCQGADIRTERLRSKPMPASKGVRPGTKHKNFYPFAPLFVFPGPS